MSAHPELVDLLALSSGQEASDTAAHAAHCAGCAGMVRELAELKEPVELEAELEAELAELDARDFVRTRPSFLDEASRLAELVVSAFAEGRDPSVFRGERLLGWALLLACQRSGPGAPRNPSAALALARAVSAEAKRLPGSMPEPARVEGEALLLAGYALHCLGRTKESRRTFREARGLFSKLTEAGMELAVTDYLEGNAASFERDYVHADDLLRHARRAFASLGQTHWVARVDSASATLSAQRGDNEAALSLFDDALRRLHPDLDAHVVVSTLVNKASTLSHLDRLVEARSAYARALQLALRMDLDLSLQVIRNGLAEIDFKRGDLGRALTSFRRLAERARAAGYAEDYAFAQLYVAECLARLGREAEMRSVVTSLSRERGSNPFGPSPAFEELFSCLDRGELDAGLIAHVREFLESRASGSETAYRPLRLRA